MSRYTTYLKNISIGLILLLTLTGGIAVADRLPQGGPENQRISVYSMIETIGVVIESTRISWQVSDAGLDSLGSPVVNADGRSVRGASIAYAAYSDSIMTNGGEFSEVKTTSLNTNPQMPGMYNIETSRILTYESVNGSHLMGAESYVLDVAGQWSSGGNDVMCVFARGASSIIPAFCNKVTAASKLSSVTSAQVQTTGSLTAVGASTDVPAALNYEISVTPNANSASGYAEGMISTTFTASIMEGRHDGSAYAVPEFRENVFTCPVDRPNCNEPVYGQVLDNLNALGLIGSIQVQPDASGNGDIVLIIGGVPLGSWAAGTLAPSNADMQEFTNAILPLGNQNLNNALAVLGIDTGAIPANGKAIDIPATIGTRGPQLIGIEPMLLDAHGNNIGAELGTTATFIDTATVRGGISTFNKAFNYQSGIRCENC